MKAGPHRLFATALLASSVLLLGGCSSSSGSSEALQPRATGAVNLSTRSSTSRQAFSPQLKPLTGNPAPPALQVGVGGVLVNPALVPAPNPYSFTPPPYGAPAFNPMELDLATGLPPMITPYDQARYQGMADRMDSTIAREQAGLERAQERLDRDPSVSNMMLYQSQKNLVDQCYRSQAEYQRLSEMGY